MGEFLRFAAVHGWVPADTTALLSEPKLLRFTPPGCDTGELGRRRQVRAAMFRFQITEPGSEDLSDEQIRRMIALAARARDRFLVALLACTGLGVAGVVAAVDAGEALRIAADAERVAQTISSNDQTFDGVWKEMALGALVVAVRAVDANEALRIAQTMTDKGLRVAALAGVARLGRFTSALSAPM
ncbi:hypothetical protein [Streptomyces sp. NBC_01615]|uniref:hypothetical protein n=1 Tax=Streptomyces sp. NBC_01615 TaxID=2975898 RepID=UPI00386B6299